MRTGKFTDDRKLRRVADTPERVLPSIRTLVGWRAGQKGTQ